MDKTMSDTDAVTLTRKEILESLKVEIAQRRNEHQKLHEKMIAVSSEITGLEEAIHRVEMIVAKKAR